MAGAKKFFKKKSKRIPTKLRVKAEKKVKEHARKLKKEKRLNPGKFAKSKKDPGVPNECPFKEDVLREVEEARKRKIEEKAARRLAIREKRAAGSTAPIAKGNLEDFVIDAEMKENIHEEKVQEETEDEEYKANAGDRSAKAYYKEFAKVVDAADVIIQVLDARDPLGTRCASVEKSVLGLASKRLILVLNKADLIPKENLEGWIKYLRREYPTIAFKSSTQMQGKNLGHSSHKMIKGGKNKNKKKINFSEVTENFELHTSKCVGAGTLMALLANYCRNKDVKTAIRVGVVGYPNVGKSSLINSLKRSRACVVGNTPGVTKVMQEIQLDSKIKLLDCPGMILESAGNRDEASALLRNAVKIENIDDIVSPVSAILSRCQKSFMQLEYDIPNYDSTHEFLTLVARGTGKMKKGGVPDIEVAGRMILRDWNGGKIKYFTSPPVDDVAESAESQVEAKVVSGFAKEFDLDQLGEVEREEMDCLPDVLPSEAMALVEESKKAAEKVEKKEKLKRKAEDTEVGLVSSKRTKKTAENGAAVLEEKVDNNSENPTNMRKTLKAKAKKEKKDFRRRDKVAQELSNEFENALGSL